MSTDPLSFLDTSEPQRSDPLSFLSEMPSKTRSLISAPLKGLIKGGATFSPLPSFGPVPSKLGEKLTEQFLPTQQGNLEDILEFTGELAPLAALGEGGLAKKGLQALSGGLTKKAAKEAELPEWLQDVAGGLGMAGPDVIKALGSKKIRPSAKQKDLYDFLKSAEFTEKEATPLLQGEKKLSALSKGAFKLQKGNPVLRSIKDKFEKNLYEPIRERGLSGKYLEGKSLHQFEDEFHNILNKIPKRHQRLINQETEELFKNPINFTALQDFNVAVNDIIKGAEGGKASVGKLKKATYDAQKRLDQKLFKELRTTDAAYSKFKNFLNKMTDKNWKNIINLGHTGTLLWGLLTFNPTYLKAAGIAAASRVGIRQILTNPRLQNVHLKMWDAVLKNKMNMALKLADLLVKELQREEVTPRLESHTE